MSVSSDNSSSVQSKTTEIDTIKSMPPVVGVMPAYEYESEGQKQVYYIIYTSISVSMLLNFEVA